LSSQVKDNGADPDRKANSFDSNESHRAIWAS
jgi:hypothetical protein